MVEATVWFILFGFAGFLFIIANLGDSIGSLSIGLGILIWILISLGMYKGYSFLIEKKILVVSKALENNESLICKGKFIVKNFIFDKENLVITDKDRKRIFKLEECRKYGGNNK